MSNFSVSLAVGHLATQNECEHLRVKLGSLFFFGVNRLSLQLEFSTAKKIRVKDWLSFQVLSDLNNVVLSNYKNSTYSNCKNMHKGLLKKITAV